MCAVFTVKRDVFRESITEEKCYYAKIAKLRAYGIIVL